jgi:osmotically inducible protein OsmC
MALALRLGKRQLVADWLSVGATVTLDDVDGLPTVISSALYVRGTVPGLDSAGFQSAVDEAAALCPISRLFAGAEISVTALLVQASQLTTSGTDAERA